MLAGLAVLQQAASVPGRAGWWQTLKNLVDTPLPYSPFSEYFLLLFIMWLVARVEHSREERKKTFDKQAQEVLDEKYRSGELSQEAYEKFRQNVTMRPRH